MQTKSLRCRRKMGDQFLALSYAISRYVEGKGPDKTFKELDEETQEFFRGLQPALFEINRRYTAHMWEKMDLLEKKWGKQGKSKDEIVIKLKKILPELTFKNPNKISTKVLFPDPFSPIIPTQPQPFILRFKPSKI